MEFTTEIAWAGCGLAYGITELKGVADNAYRAVEHHESYEAGLALGPRLFNTGEAIDGERVYYPMMIPTTSEAQLHRELGRLKGAGLRLRQAIRAAFLCLGSGGAQSSAMNRWECNPPDITCCPLSTWAKMG